MRMTKNANNTFVNKIYVANKGVVCVCVSAYEYIFCM